MAISQHQSNSDTDDWTLTTEQMLFMLQNRNVIDTAYAQEDIAFLRELAASEEYKRIFKDMSFDEAYDRYETMMEDGGAT